MRILLLILGLHQLSYGQTTITTESFSEKRWIINSSINLPAVKFHIADSTSSDDPTNEVKGHLELFSSFGVGFSLNFGDATFRKNVDTDEILLDDTEFRNLIGFQFGVLYSSKLDAEEENNINDFSLYSGLNLLDLQVGVGYELGVQRQNSTRWFVSIAYGIPIYKLTGRGSYIFKKRPNSTNTPSQSENPLLLASLQNK